MRLKWNLCFTRGPKIITMCDRHGKKWEISGFDTCPGYDDSAAMMTIYRQSDVITSDRVRELLGKARINFVITIYSAVDDIRRNYLIRVVGDNYSIACDLGCERLDQLKWTEHKPICRMIGLRDIIPELNVDDY